MLLWWELSIGGLVGVSLVLRLAVVMFTEVDILGELTFEASTSPTLFVLELDPGVMFNLSDHSRMFFSTGGKLL